MAFMAIEHEQALPSYVPPLPAAQQPANPQTSAEAQNLAELKRWFAENKFSEAMLRRLMAHPGVQDVQDLACLNDEELQQAGFTPVQLKRFTLLQHKMNDPNEHRTIGQISQMLEDVKKQLVAGVIGRAAAEYMTNGLCCELARETRTDPTALFQIFLANLDSSSPAPAPVPDVPQFMTFTPSGSITIKISRPGESDQLVETDSNGRLDLNGMSFSKCTLQPMTKTEPPIPIGSPVQLELPLTAKKTVDLPASTVRPMFLDHDKPLIDGDASGRFESEIGGVVVEFSGKTSVDGSMNLVLPAGKISQLCARSACGSVTVNGSSMSIAHRSSGDDPITLRSLFSQKSSKIPFLNHCKGDRVAFLGDISGSMSGAGITLLKSTLNAAVDDVLVPNSVKTVALCAWNDSPKWFEGKRWLDATAKDNVKCWIQQLQAGGGTEMQPAIEDAVRLQNVTDIVVLCDGEFSDFDFRAIRKRCPDVGFSFVAIGQSAAWEKMQALAHQAQGFFQHEK